MKAVSILVIDGVEKSRLSWENYSEAVNHVEGVVEQLARMGLGFHKMEQESARWVDTAGQNVELIIASCLF